MNTQQRRCLRVFVTLVGTTSAQNERGFNAIRRMSNIGDICKYCNCVFATGRNCCNDIIIKNNCFIHFYIFLVRTRVPGIQQRRFGCGVVEKCPVTFAVVVHDIFAHRAYNVYYTYTPDMLLYRYSDIITWDETETNII